MIDGDYLEHVNPLATRPTEVQSQTLLLISLFRKDCICGEDRNNLRIYTLSSIILSFQMISTLIQRIMMIQMRMLYKQACVFTPHVFNGCTSIILIVYGA